MTGRLRKCGLALQSTEMPPGDAQRTWFPQMVAELRGRWSPALSLTEMIALRDEFDVMLHHIRSTRPIRTPLIRCPRCGHVGPAAEPDVSARSMIITLGRFGIVSGMKSRSSKEPTGRRTDWTSTVNQRRRRSWPGRASTELPKMALLR